MSPASKHSQTQLVGLMNYYFIPGNGNTFFYVIATKLAEITAIYYFNLNRSQRMFKSYEPPEQPIYRVGTIEQTFSEDWFTTPNSSSRRFEGTLDECKARLIAEPIGSAIDLAKIV